MTIIPPDPGTPEAIEAGIQAAANAATVAELESAAKLLRESERRARESLRLYEPNPFQEQLHSCTAKELLVTAGTQVGKSLCGFAELARVCTVQDPYAKYPKTGRAVVVGWDDGHIGRVVFPYLFMPGKFRIFKDRGEWKTWKPWIHTDVSLEDTEPAPALIPDRFVKKFVWRKFAQRVFSRVDFRTGWELFAFSSRGMPAQGFEADYVHIDEDIQVPQWYSEMVSRGTMRKGKIRWTALPHGRNDAMQNLIERAEDDLANEPEDRDSVHIHATVFDNPYMDDRTRQANIKIWKSEGEDVYRQRALGELTTDSALVYPAYSKYLHNALEQGQRISAARKIYINGSGAIPEDWNVSMIVDPGHAVCAVEFIATPPPSLGMERFVCLEVTVKNSTATAFAKAVERAVRDRGIRPYQLQRFIIDAHGGALTSFETGISPRAAYTRELKKIGFVSIETGAEFISGSDDIAGREGSVREWLNINDATGEPTLFIDHQRCPELVKTIPRFKKLVSDGFVQDKANRRLPCHHIECIEYGAANGLKYVDPPRASSGNSRVRTILEEMKKRAQQRAARAGARTAISLGPVA